MLKVGMAVPHHRSVPPTPTPLRDRDTESVLKSSHSSGFLEAAHAPHSPLPLDAIDPRSAPHLTYGTFGTFAPPCPHDSAYPGLAVGFSAGSPITPKPRRLSRTPHGLTVQVPHVPLESVRRHVTEMLFNIRDDDDVYSHAPSSPLTRSDSRYSVRSRRSRPSIEIGRAHV